MAKMNLKKVTKGTQEILKLGVSAGSGIVVTNLVGWGFGKLVGLIDKENKMPWLSGGIAEAVARIGGIIFLLPQTPYVKKPANLKVAQAAASAQIILSLLRRFIPAAAGSTMEKVKAATLGDWRKAMGFPTTSNTGFLPSRSALVGNIGQRIPPKRVINLKGIQAAKGVYYA